MSNMIAEKIKDYWNNMSFQRRAFSAITGGTRHPSDGFGVEALRQSREGLVGAGKAAFSGLNVFQDGGGVLAHGVSGIYHAPMDYFKWRGNAAALMRENRIKGDAAMANETLQEAIKTSVKNKTPLSEAHAAEAKFMKYGKHPKHGDGFRAFGARSAGEHIGKGFHNFVRYSVASPVAWGLNLGLAIHASSDNLLDPKEGLAKTLAANVLSEVGFVGGSAVGAAAATAAIPTGGAVVAGVGMLAGGIGGAMLAAAAVDGVVSLSSWGNRNGRHGRPFRANFQDSQQASTMRQRAVQSINRSQMSARSAFGNEALAMHQ